VINVSSLGSFFPLKYSAVYGASKTFLTMFSQALQLEVQADGIRVQCLCPGYTRSDFGDRGPMAKADASRVPDELWWAAEDIVAVSLTQLESESGGVLCLPDESSRKLVQQALSAQAAEFA
jgi:short-subunit dehydrogenase